jgi:hypothetical protein
MEPEEKKLKDTVLSVSDKSLGQYHCLTEDSFYKSMKAALNLLDDTSV